MTTLLLTLLALGLVGAGTALYVTGFVGWAQCAWVFASGVAGAAVMSWSDEG